MPENEKQEDRIELELPEEITPISKEEAIARLRAKHDHPPIQIGGETITWPGLEDDEAAMQDVQDLLEDFDY